MGKKASEERKGIGKNRNNEEENNRRAKYRKKIINNEAKLKIIQEEENVENNEKRLKENERSNRYHETSWNEIINGENVIEEKKIEIWKWSEENEKKKHRKSKKKWKCYIENIWSVATKKIINQNKQSADEIFGIIIIERKPQHEINQSKMKIKINEEKWRRR